MPPDPATSSRLRRSQRFPVRLKVARLVRRLGTLPSSVFGSCIAYSSNINYLVPFLEVRFPPTPPPPDEKSWLQACIITKVIFSFRKSVFRDVRTDYNLDLRFLVKLKKQISMIMADLSQGHINIFRGDTRSLCFSWYTRGLCSQVTQRTNKS